MISPRHRPLNAFDFHIPTVEYLFTLHENIDANARPNISGRSVDCFCEQSGRLPIVPFFPGQNLLTARMRRDVN